MSFEKSPNIMCNRKTGLEFPVIHTMFCFIFLTLLLLFLVGLLLFLRTPFFESEKYFILKKRNKNKKFTDSILISDFRENWEKKYAFENIFSLKKWDDTIEGLVKNGMYERGT